MRASVVFSTIALASAAFAAPLVGLPVSVSGIESEVESEVNSLGLTSTLGSTGVKRDTVPSVSSLETELEHEVNSLGLTPTLSSAGVKRVSVDNVDAVVETVEDAAYPVVTKVEGTLKSRDLLDLGNALGTVTSLLQTILSTATGLEGKLTSLIGQVESVNVEGVLSDAEGLAGTLLSAAQEISNDTGLGISLAALDPLLNTVTGEVTSVLSIVQGLIGQGITGDVVSTIESELSQTLSVLKGVNL